MNLYQHATNYAVWSIYSEEMVDLKIPTSTTAVDWHLKVKDIEYDVGLTKNNCITVSMQKLSSIHILILMIQQILGSHELSHLKYIFINSFLIPMTKLATPIFDYAQSKNFWTTFSLCEVVSICKYFPKYGICARTQQIISLYYRTNSVKINDYTFQWIQKTLFFGPFLVHFPNFRSKKKFTHNFIWVSSTISKFRKN